MKIVFAIIGTFIAAFITLVAVGHLVNGGASAGGSSAIDASNAQGNVIDACQEAVKKGLKDPDSARFDDWTASQEATGSQYIATGMVNAKNGFGGYDGDSPYTCDAEVSDHTVRAQAHPGS